MRPKSADRHISTPPAFTSADRQARCGWLGRSGARRGTHESDMDASVGIARSFENLAPTVLHTSRKKTVAVQEVQIGIDE